MFAVVYTTNRTRGCKDVARNPPADLPFWRGMVQREGLAGMLKETGSLDNHWKAS